MPKSRKRAPRKNEARLHPKGTGKSRKSIGGGKHMVPLSKKGQGGIGSNLTKALRNTGQTLQRRANRASARKK